MGLFTDLATAVIPSLISGGVALYGSSKARDANRQAANDYAVGAQEGADILSAGQVEALDYLLGANDQVRGIFEQALAAGQTQLEAAATAYGAATQGGLASYSDLLQAGLTDYGALTGQTLGATVDTLGQGSRAAMGTVDAGRDAVAAEYAPYQEAGRDALAQLRAVALSDPGALTPSQQRLVEDTRADMRARLAASGLRGAGRAGVATFNDGDAALAARLHDQNQDRIDRATETLGRYGYGATGSVADATQTAALTNANTLLRTAGQQADAITAAGQRMANARLDTSRDVAGATLDTARDVASNTQRLSLAGSQMGQDYFRQLADLATSDASLRADATTSIAEAQAGAKSNASYMGAQANIANSDSSNRLYGTLAAISSDAIKKALEAYGKD
ncbi:hypothetical protein F1188_10995 [Roseospira marina]|uniref:Uncharacterized protein n=1 Tax=Roseospira marina TaxID=140057 RepID=A0A5M6IB10_9PROT|nr:hypothetical protein [Roseospira marina]KAA5605421.1 hypothetical protein F1188_10995 [Roseospira marina]MBB4314585.1 cell division septum initiation protein DivIVA [Roseospira marina]MBB5088853.1 cell division septum initiation protein DivIVA [Roseospira marina]